MRHITIIIASVMLACGSDSGPGVPSDGSDPSSSNGKSLAGDSPTPTQDNGGAGGADTNSSGGDGSTPNIDPGETGGTGGVSSTGGAGGSAGSSSDGGAQSSGTGGAGGTEAGSCPADCGYTCCGSACADTSNDPFNCGGCGNVCSGATPYCDETGTCAMPPCSGATCSGTTSCCGSQCCDDGQLCCWRASGCCTAFACHTPTEEQPTCPKILAVGCTSPNTTIATPEGDKSIAALKVGDLVYSVDGEQITPVPLLRISRTPVVNHHVERVVFATGTVLEISAMHPTADGRTFASLRADSILDNIEILSVETIPYQHPFTYDILPDSDTGTYFAGGVLIGSTLGP